MAESELKLKIIDGQVAVPSAALVGSFFSSYEALKKKLQRDKKRIDGIHRIQRGGGKRKNLLIDYDTLPEHMQEYFTDPRKKEHVLELFIEEDPAAVRYFGNIKPGKGGCLKPERQAKYVYEAKILQAAIRLKENRTNERKRMGMSLKNIDKTVCDDVVSHNKMIENKIKALRSDSDTYKLADNFMVHNLPENYRRLAEKMENFQKDSYSSLLKGYVNINSRKRTDELEGLLNAMYINAKKPTPTEVGRLYEGFISGYVQVINPQTGEEYLPENFGKVIKARTVEMFLSKWKERVATHLKRSADRQKYMTKYVPHETLEDIKYAGSVISIDDRQPPFNYATSKRVWFYNGIDLGSECIMAFVWGKTKEGLIVDFYRELVRNCAEWGVSIPAELECESSLNASFKDTLLKEGNMFEYVRIIANSAHTKKIERYFGMLRNNVEKDRAGWIGRPFARNEALATNPDNKELVPYDQIIKGCLQDIMNWNNTEHSSIEGKTRWEVFMENQYSGLQPINWRGILPYIGEFTRTSCKKGNVLLNNGEYLLGDNGEICTGDDLLGYMEEIEGRDIEVRWLAGHKGQILKALVYRKERCICELIEKPKTYRSQLEAQADPEAAAKREIMARYNNTITGYARRHKNEIEKLLIIDNRVKTLNNKFQLPYMGFISDNSDIKQSGEFEEFQILETVEIDSHSNNVQTAKEWSLKDNF